MARVVTVPGRGGLTAESLIPLLLSDQLQRGRQDEAFEMRKELFEKEKAFQTSEWVAKTEAATNLQAEQTRLKSVSDRFNDLILRHRLGNFTQGVGEGDAFPDIESREGAILNAFDPEDLKKLGMPNPQAYLRTAIQSGLSSPKDIHEAYSLMAMNDEPGGLLESMKKRQKEEFRTSQTMNASREAALEEAQKDARFRDLYNVNLTSGLDPDKAFDETAKVLPMSSQQFQQYNALKDRRASQKEAKLNREMSQLLQENNRAGDDFNRKVAELSDVRGIIRRSNPSDVQGLLSLAIRNSTSWAALDAVKGMDQTEAFNSRVLSEPVFGQIYGSVDEKGKFTPRLFTGGMLGDSASMKGFAKDLQPRPGELTYQEHLRRKLGIAEPPKPVAPPGPTTQAPMGPTRPSIMRDYAAPILQSGFQGAMDLPGKVLGAVGSGLAALDDPRTYGVGQPQPQQPQPQAPTPAFPQGGAIQQQGTEALAQRLQDPQRQKIAVATGLALQLHPETVGEVTEAVGRSGLNLSDLSAAYYAALQAGNYELANKLLDLANLMGANGP